MPTNRTIRFAKRVPQAYDANIIVGELRAGIGRADQRLREYGATLLAHVREVLGLCSKEHMFWTNTGHDIALMAQFDSGWQRAMNQFPCNTVGALNRAADANLSVAMRA